MWKIGLCSVLYYLRVSNYLVLYKQRVFTWVQHKANVPLYESGKLGQYYEKILLSIKCSC